MEPHASADRHNAHTLLLHLICTMFLLCMLVGDAAAVVGNNPPILGPVGAKVAQEGRILTFDLRATDAEGDLLTYGGSGLPAGARVDAASGTFVWMPTDGQAGFYRNVTFTVSDSASSDAAEITITCFQRPAVSPTPAILGLLASSPTDELAYEVEVAELSGTEELWATDPVADDGEIEGGDDGIGTLDEEIDAWDDDFEDYHEIAINDRYAEEYDYWYDAGSDDVPDEGDDSIPTTTEDQVVYYGKGIGSTTAQQTDGTNILLPLWSAKTAGATRRVLISLPGISGSDEAGTLWIEADPMQLTSIDDDLLVVEKPEVTAMIGTDGLSTRDGLLRGRATAIEFRIMPVAAELPVGEVSSAVTLTAMSLPAPASQAVVSLSSQPNRGMQAAFEQAAADSSAEIRSFAAVSSVTVDNLPIFATICMTVPAEWVSMQGIDTCRILSVRSDGSHAAILPTAAEESDGRVTFTATSYSAGTFALASMSGGGLPEVATGSDPRVIGAEPPDTSAAAVLASDVPKKSTRHPSLLWQLLISTGGAFSG